MEQRGAPLEARVADTDKSNTRAHDLKVEVRAARKSNQSELAAENRPSETAKSKMESAVNSPTGESVDEGGSQDGGGSARDSIVAAWNQEEVARPVKPNIIHVLHPDANVPPSPVNTEPAFSAPFPHPTDPSKILLRNPWDSDVAVLDKEAERKAAATFFARHVTDFAPSVRPGKGPGLHERPTTGVDYRRRKSSKDLVPAPTSALTAGTTEREVGPSFSLSALVPPLVAFPDSQQATAKQASAASQKGANDRKTDLPSSAFAEEMLALFNTAFSEPGAESASRPDGKAVSSKNSATRAPNHPARTAMSSYVAEGSAKSKNDTPQRQSAAAEVRHVNNTAPPDLQTKSIGVVPPRPTQGITAAPGPNFPRPPPKTHPNMVLANAGGSGAAADSSMGERANIDSSHSKHNIHPALAMKIPPPQRAPPTPPNTQASTDQHHPSISNRLPPPPLSAPTHVPIESPRGKTRFSTIPGATSAIIGELQDRNYASLSRTESGRVTGAESTENLNMNGDSSNPDISGANAGTIGRANKIVIKPRLTTVTPTILSAKRANPIAPASTAGGSYTIGSGQAQIPRTEVGNKDSSVQQNSLDRPGESKKEKQTI
ncbi:hypothetical protein DFS34DRAFT_650896 [Phlyctochytrium arcticum]|nr:hypothetical protein DFS34DRAFT_650896 [Phlyctochytrium arcticum]